MAKLNNLPKVAWQISSTAGIQTQAYNLTSVSSLLVLLRFFLSPLKRFQSRASLMFYFLLVEVSLSEQRRSDGECISGPEPCFYGSTRKLWFTFSWHGIPSGSAFPGDHRTSLCLWWEVHCFWSQSRFLVLVIVVLPHAEQELPFLEFSG